MQGEPCCLLLPRFSMSGPPIRACLLSSRSLPHIQERLSHNHVCFLDRRVFSTFSSQTMQALSADSHLLYHTTWRVQGTRAARACVWWRGTRRLRHIRRKKVCSFGGRIGPSFRGRGAAICRLTYTAHLQPRTTSFGSSWGRSSQSTRRHGGCQVVRKLISTSMATIWLDVLAKNHMTNENNIRSTYHLKHSLNLFITKLIYKSKKS